MNFIVYDLEATCWEVDIPGRIQEVIEIGALKINEYGETESQFSSFVRPRENPLLSDFCRRLTTISQIDVNRADDFPTVIADFIDWIGYNDDEEYLLCSWGFFDQKAFERDCRLHRLDADWCRPHISLKHQYNDINRLAKPIGLRRAVEREGFDFTGTPHRGISDAENLAKIFVKYQDIWAY